MDTQASEGEGQRALVSGRPQPSLPSGTGVVNPAAASQNPARPNAPGSPSRPIGTAAMRCLGRDRGGPGGCLTWSLGVGAGHPRRGRSLERLQTCRGGALSSGCHAPRGAVQRSPRWPSEGSPSLGGPSWRLCRRSADTASGRRERHTHAAWGGAGGRGTETAVGCREVAFLTHFQVAPKPQAIENHIWSRRLCASACCGPGASRRGEGGDRAGSVRRALAGGWWAPGRPLWGPLGTCWEPVSTWTAPGRCPAGARVDLGPQPDHPGTV